MPVKLFMACFIDSTNEIETNYRKIKNKLGSLLRCWLYVDTTVARLLIHRSVLYGFRNIHIYSFKHGQVQGLNRKTKKKKRKENLAPWKQNIKEMSGGSRLLHSTVTP